MRKGGEEGMNLWSVINNAFEGIAMTMAGTGSSMSIWGENDMPDCLKEKVAPASDVSTVNEE